MSSKTLSRVAQNLGLCYDVGRKTVYGSYAGYAVAVRAHGKLEYLLTVSAGTNDPNLQEQLKTGLLALSQRPCIISVNCANRSVSVAVRGKQGDDAANLSAALSEATAVCASLGLSNICRYCGREIMLSPCSIDGQIDYLCDDCYTELLSRRNDKADGRGNPVTGAIGGLLGALLGMVLWVVIYQFGFIAGIAGFAMLAFAVRGYELFGGRLTRGALVYCFAVALVMPLVAENVALVVECLKVIFSRGMSPFQFDFAAMLAAAWGDSHMRAAMIGDLVMGYLLYAIAGAPFAIQMFQAAKYKKECVKL